MWVVVWINESLLKFLLYVMAIGPMLLFSSCTQFASDSPAELEAVRQAATSAGVDDRSSMDFVGRYYEIQWHLQRGRICNGEGFATGEDFGLPPPFLNHDAHHRR